MTRHWAKSFYFASLFLPRQRRDAAYAVYAVCRDCDNAVDHPDAAGPQAGLDRNRQRIAAVYQSAALTDPVWAAFQDTVRRYQIPRRYFDDLLAGMAMDLTPARYPDFPALSVYCYRAAGVVGLIMLRIFGYQDPAAEQCAVDLGIAMQLTNILRDIQEDYQRGRIYLPQEDLRTFKVQEQTLAQASVDPPWQSLLTFEIARARAFYQRADQGIPPHHRPPLPAGGLRDESNLRRYSSPPLSGKATMSSLGGPACPYPKKSGY